VCGCETIPSPLRRRLDNGVVSRVSEGGISKGVGEERHGGAVPVEDITMPLPCSVRMQCCSRRVQLNMIESDESCVGAATTR